MSREAATAQAAPTRPLSRAASSQLAHDLRAAIHVIRGHADLLRGDSTQDETRESAGYIFDASVRVGNLCEDVVDFLRLPAVARAAPVPLALDALSQALQGVANDRGVPLQVVQPERDAPVDGAGVDVRGGDVMVDGSVRRVVAHVLDHILRSTVSTVTIVPTVSSVRAQCTVAVSPVPPGSASGDDGIIAIATDLLAAHDAQLRVVGEDRIELVFAVVG